MRNTPGFLSVVIISAVISTGCATQSPGIAPSATVAPSPATAPSTAVMPAPAAAPASPVATISPKPQFVESGKNDRILNLTPFTAFTDMDGDDSANGGNFTNSYTRIRINSSISASSSKQTNVGTQNLRYEQRNWLKRYFLGKKFDANLSVKIRTGGYEVTVPLVTVGHQSTSDGEQWSRTISQKLVDFPLFLVRPDGEASVPSFQIRMAGTKEYSSNMAGKALELVVAGIQAVSPESGVLTTLSTQATKDKSQAVDAAIGKLFSNGIAEEHVVHRDLRKWNNAGGVSIFLYLPQDENDWNDNLGQVGTWNISFEEPRPSIFGDWRICEKDNPKIRCAKDRETALKNVHMQVSANQILFYPLLKSNKELGTVSAFLLQQDWYGKSMAEFNGNLSEDSAIADAMCLKIQNSIVSLGLNNDDADLVTWGFVNGLPWAKKMNKDAFTGKRADGVDSSCARAVRRVNSNRV